MIKCWLCKPENLSSASSTQLKNKQQTNKPSQVRCAPKIPVLAKQRQEDLWGVANQSSQVYKLQLQGDLLSKIYCFGFYHSLELIWVCGKTKTSKLAILLQTDYCPAPLHVLATLTELTLCICVVFLWTLYSILWVNLSILELKPYS